MSIKLTRTGKKIPFKHVSIGSVFYSYGEYWTRNEYESATELTSSADLMGNACFFCLEDVEEVLVIIDKKEK